MLQRRQRFRIDDFEREKYRCQSEIIFGGVWCRQGQARDIMPVTYDVSEFIRNVCTGSAVFSPARPRRIRRSLIGAGP